MLPLLALLLALGLGCVVVLGRVGAASADRSRAQTAADAAALAGVHGGPAAAREAAEANGGALASFAVVDGVIEVEVELGDGSASARATLRTEGAGVEGR